MPSKLKISFFGIWPEIKEYVHNQTNDFNATISYGKIDEKKLDEDTEVLAVFVETPVTKEIIEKLPNLKMIAAMSTGFDHIDLTEAKKRNIAVCNVPTYGENTVAEHTMALILGLTRKLFPSVKRVKEGLYNFRGLQGMDLKDKILGVIGTGHIGANVIKMAKGFDLKIIAFDAFPNKDLATKLDFEYVSLEKLLTESDIITLHTPLLPTTHHLINTENIKKTKSGAYIINTARGALIDPEALVWGLQNNHLAGVGLDVLEDENLIQNHEQIISCNECQIKTTLLNEIIIDHPNSIITPHNAFNSAESLKRIIDATINNIKSFSEGKIINDVTVRKK